MFARDVTREERLEEMRRDFVANVSHELRTPLTVITGYLMTIFDSGCGDDHRLQKPLVQMQQQAQRMETLLGDLLWLSRLESLEDDEENQSPIVVADMLAEVRQEAMDIYPQREIGISIHSEKRLNGNYQHLYSAVSNLLLNALKYSEGSVEMLWEEDSRHLYLSVRDQGPGIDAVHIPRLTERFYRVDKSRSQETGGTGLGLAIVKHVLAGHDAHIEIDSTPGVGSRFRCIFPLS
jgi:two-component system phosphate regulon sensor histidine kinase PhoR